MLALFKKEYWWANLLGLFFILGATFGLVRFIPKLPKWEIWQEALPSDLILPIVLWGVGLAALTGIALKAMGEDVGKYLKAFPFIYGLTVVSFLIGNQATLNHYGFSDVI